MSLYIAMCTVIELKVKIAKFRSNGFAHCVFLLFTIINIQYLLKSNHVMNYEQLS